jgi:hypothetical protein
MSSNRRLEGYLLIDNRASPGVPAEMLRATGKDVPSLGFGEGQIFESATITCSHCHTIVILNPDRSRPRNYCRRCDHYICDNPGCHTGCLPLNDFIDQTRETIARQTQAGLDPTVALSILLTP